MAIWLAAAVVIFGTTAGIDASDASAHTHLVAAHASATTAAASAAGGTTRAVTHIASPTPTPTATATASPPAGAAATTHSGGTAHTAAPQPSTPAVAPPTITTPPVATPPTIPSRPTVTPEEDSATCDPTTISGALFVSVTATDGGTINPVRIFINGVSYPLSPQGGALWGGSYAFPNSGGGTSIPFWIDVTVSDSKGGSVDREVEAVAEC